MYGMLDWLARVLRHPRKKGRQGQDPGDSKQDTRSDNKEHETEETQETEQTETKEENEKEQKEEQDSGNTVLEEWMARKDEGDDVQLIKNFEACTLQCALDDYVLVRVCYAYFKKHGRRDGLKKIFEGLKGFYGSNASVSEKCVMQKYNVSVCYCVAHMVWYAMQSCKHGYTRSFETWIVMNPRLCDLRGLCNEFYTDDVLYAHDQIAEREFIAPNVKALPSVTATVDIASMKSKAKEADVDVMSVLSGMVDEDLNSNDEQFITEFELGTLKAWKHEYVLRATWYYLQYYGRMQGKEKVFEEFERHYGSEAFHLTLCYFWLQMVDYYRMIVTEERKQRKQQQQRPQSTDTTDTERNQKQNNFKEWITYLRSKSPPFKIGLKRTWISKASAYNLDDAQLHHLFYSQDVLFGKGSKANTQMVLPDLQPLPSIKPK